MTPFQLKPFLRLLSGRVPDRQAITRAVRLMQDDNLLPRETYAHPVTVTTRAGVVPGVYVAWGECETVIALEVDDDGCVVR